MKEGLVLDLYKSIVMPSMINIGGTSNVKPHF